MKNRHRLRPQISCATRAKGALALLDLRITAAKLRGDKIEADRLETEKAWLTINSVLP